MSRLNASFDRCVLGDWGTTRLRLFLFHGDELSEQREGPGIGALTASPAATLQELVASWITAQPLPLVLAGMAGSRNGLFEAPYVQTPVDRTSWAHAACCKQLGPLQVTIAAGLRDDHRTYASDAMRGEETQIFGALRLDPALLEGSHLIVLPGTHCKWVEVSNGVIVRFHTALTGELFALLRDHSILLKAGDGGAAADADAGFLAGGQRSAQLNEGLLGAMFEARTAQLLRQRSRAWASGFLSGLLIGHEIGGMMRAYSPARRVRIIGDAKLTTLYRSAFASRGVTGDLYDGSACAIAGLRDLHGYLAGDET
ncbi:MAG: 2-dehydro-3-deoxygalactonokinase [Steroidobacter sp.]